MITDWTWNDTAKRWEYTPTPVPAASMATQERAGYVSLRGPGTYMAFYGSECLGLDYSRINDAMRAIENRHSRESLTGIPDTSIRPIPPDKTPQGGVKE